jgi:cysteine desulfurase
MIYFDNNATTRVLPEVREAMLPYFSETFFNPVSAAGALHGTGKPLQDAGEALARLIGCLPEEVVLTSGATEANNWVLKSVARRALRGTGRCHMLLSAIEHPSILEVASYLAEIDTGFEVDLIPVTADGIVDLDAFKSLLRPDTALVSVMLANNETGVIQPVAEIAAISKESSPGSFVHTDATQAIGKIVVSLHGSLENVDFLSLSAHKFHGPKGIGALYIRSGIHLEPLIHGGGQQGGARSGTDNPALAAGLSKAAEIAVTKLDDEHLAMLRNSLEGSLQAQDVRILGGNAQRLPNTSLLLFENRDADMLIHQLLDAGFATATGSACSSGSDTPSHVVLAMGVDYSSAAGALRISLSRDNTEDDILCFVETIRGIISPSLNSTE